MASNFVADGRYQEHTVASTVTSGDPVVLGSYLHGVAQGDYGTGSSSTKAVIDLGPAIYTLNVKGHDGLDNAAISAYSPVYYDSALGGLNANTSGVFFGYALEAVSSGATSAIRVYVVQGAP